MKCTYVVSTDAQRDVLAELALERLRVLLLQQLHVISHVLAENVRTMDLGVEALRLGTVAGETLHGMRDVQATVNGALHRAEHASSRRGAAQTDIQVATERARSIVDRLHVVLAAGHLGGALVQAVQAQFLQNTTGHQQTGAVRGGIVGQTNLDAILGQLVRVGGANDAITLDARVRDLAGDVAVARTHDQTVLGRVVLVLVLEDQALASIVVGLSLTTPLELDLVPLEVLLVLHDFHETLRNGVGSTVEHTLAFGVQICPLHPGEHTISQMHTHKNAAQLAEVIVFLVANWPPFWVRFPRNHQRYNHFMVHTIRIDDFRAAGQSDDGIFYGFSGV